MCDLLIPTCSFQTSPHSTGREASQGCLSSQTRQVSLRARHQPPDTGRSHQVPAEQGTECPPSTAGPSYTRFYQENFPKEFSLCWAGCITNLWLVLWAREGGSSRDKHTPTPLPTSQRGVQFPSAGIQPAKWKRQVLKGNSGCPQALPCHPGLVQRDLCSITSQHTQQKGTEKAVWNKENPELEHSSQ